MNIVTRVLYPGQDANMEALATYYHRNMYTADEIHRFLVLRHNIKSSKTGVRKLFRRLGLRKYRNEFAITEIVEKIRYIHELGFENLGYRAIWRMLNCDFGIRITQETVRRLLLAIDPVGVNIRRRHRLRRRSYLNRGPNFCIHIYGYDKLKPYGFPIHGGIDGYSRKILWLKVVRSNNDPYVVSRLYFDYILAQGCIPKVVRADAGNENVVIRDVHRALRYFNSDSMSGTESFLTGRSTANQRIEMLWGLLMKHFTNFWRNLFKDMEDTGLLNTANNNDIETLRLSFTNVLQLHLDTFKLHWNNHRIRPQRTVMIPTSSTPDVLFYQAEMFDAFDCSQPLPLDLDDLATLFEQFSTTEPTHGCSEEFFESVLHRSGIRRELFLLPETPRESILMYAAIKQLQ